MNDNNSPVSVVSGAWRAIFILTSIIMALISIFQVVGEPTFHPDWMYTVSYLCSLWFGIYIICSYAQFKTFYLFTSAYIILLSIFHLGRVIPYSFGYFENFQWKSFEISEKWLERAGWYTVLSLACIGIGFGMSWRRSCLRSNTLSIRANAISNKLLKNLYFDGIGLLIASLIFFVIGIISLGNLLNYSREDFFLKPLDLRGFGVFLMVVPGAAVMLMIGARRRSEKIFASLVAIILLIVLLLSGWRSWALFPTMVGIIIWVKVGRRMPTALAISTVVIVIAVIPVIGYLRAIGPYNKINTKAIETSMKMTKAQDTFIVLGGTSAVLAFALKYVPEIDPYKYGMTYVKALSDSIPNIMPRQSESYRVETKKKARTDPSAIGNMLIPSSWITYRIDRFKFNEGAGYGFSAIGEPYINFGIGGVLFYFILVGFLLGRLDSTNLLENNILITFSCAFLWHFLNTVRNDFSNFIKPSVFILICLLIWRMVMKIFNLNKGS